MFAGKHGFITPRDLFKWAERGAVGYEELAQNGYLLLGERLRTPEDRALVQRVLEKQMKVQVGLFQATQTTQNECDTLQGNRTTTWKKLNSEAKGQVGLAHKRKANGKYKIKEKHALRLGDQAVLGQSCY